MLLGLIIWALLALAPAQSLPRAVDSNNLFNLHDKPGTSQQANEQSPPACGYSSCPTTDPNRINVHLVAHSHDDVGWLKTVDQYYYGTRNYNARVGVQFILDSIIPELVMDKTKRFIYVEMSFFTKWWLEQDEQMRGLVKRLVNEGRLEFINGGWCMNDEATVSYQSTIEQMTLGLKFLNDTFGTCGHPKVGWQIDPFGHSSEQASLFAQFGFDGMFFSRISSEDKESRIRNKSLDLIWHGDRALSGQSGSIFTNIFRDGYDSPKGFCFDILCADDGLVDNSKSYEYNIDRRGSDFISYLREYAKIKSTNHVLVPMGGDFQYSAAGHNFKNLDKLIRYIRSVASDINVFYSTPSCYQVAVHQAVSEKSLRLPEKYDDFMPYDSSHSVWWSGYFSSRPSVKLVEREVAGLLQMTRLISLANLLKSAGSRKWIDEVREHESKCLQPLWEVLGDLQHHDAITGTEKQHVADDYVRRAWDASTHCARFIGELRRAKINDFAKRSARYEQLRESGKRFKLDPLYLETTMFCPQLNISQCDAIEAEVNFKRYTVDPTSHKTNQNAPEIRHRRASGIPSPQKASLPPELATKAVLINVYNPLDRQINQHDIRLPCNGICDLEHVKVIHLSTNETMKLIRLPVPAGITKLPFRDAVTNFEILFYANLPPLGYTSFVLEDQNIDEIVEEELDVNDSIVIADEPDPLRAKNSVKNRRIKRKDEPQYEEIALDMSIGSGEPQSRSKRDLSSLSQQQNSSDRVILKFDMSSGMIVGLRRVSDGSLLNITQKFGFYFPANSQARPGAYIFRPNSSEPQLIEKPISYRMYKRKNGAFIEIHQKWADWIWQTIRVDAKKNYIEFDYLIGPIPVSQPGIGREVVSRYITNMANNGIFLTDSNDRQLLARHRTRSKHPEDLGGSFFPVVSTIVLKKLANSSRCNKCSTEAVAILVDRPQAGTSLNEGQLELLVHRRQLEDDNWGVGEPLNEPGEDGRGLVSRGKHRLYLKFRDQPQEPEAINERLNAEIFRLPETPRANMDFMQGSYVNKTGENNSIRVTSTSSFLVNDQIYNELRQESRKLALRPILTFDRLRVSASEFLEMIAPDGNSKIKTDLSLLNKTLPNNVHLLTLQPWTRAPNEILIRLENLDNPLIVYPFPHYEGYQKLLDSYDPNNGALDVDQNDACADKLRPKVEVDIEYLIKKIRIKSLEELNLGANARLVDDQRLDWTNEVYDASNCESSALQTQVKLAPRQIRTFIARFEHL